MSTRSLDAVLCHCDPGGTDGHPLGTPGCAAPKITARNYGPADWRALIESGMRADVRAAHRELRAHLRCVAETDAGVPCSNRATRWPALYCGVHW